MPSGTGARSCSTRRCSSSPPITRPRRRSPSRWIAAATTTISATGRSPSKPRCSTRPCSSPRARRGAFSSGGWTSLSPPTSTYLRAAGLLEPPADAPGPVLGEGAAFFMLCGERGGNDLARFLGTGFTYAPGRRGTGAGTFALFRRAPARGRAPRPRALRRHARPRGHPGTLGRWAFCTPRRARGSRNCAGSFTPQRPSGSGWRRSFFTRVDIPAVLPVRGTPPPQLRSVLVLTHHQDREFAWSLLGHV